MFDSIANFFRPKPKQPLPSLTDPFFGPLVYFPSAGLWSGAVQFPPIEREVEILIEADASGPIDAQRAFFNELVTRWPQVESAIGAMLFPPMKDWAKRDYDESNPWGYFDLRGIKIPVLASEQPVWSVSYWCAPVKHHFDVQMCGWETDGLNITRK